MAEQELLPPFDSVMNRAAALRRDSHIRDVNAVLMEIAAGHFSASEEEKLLLHIQMQTGIGSRALRSDLKTCKAHLKAQAPKVPATTSDNANADAWKYALVLNEA